MPKTLLLADDSVTIQKVVGISLANEDIQLVTVENGDDAIARATEVRPDIVLADIVMPGKNGYEVCEAIKTDSDLSATPVLLLTGTFEAFDAERARHVGADGHITKPFEAQALVDQVNQLLARATPLQDTKIPAPPQETKASAPPPQGVQAPAPPVPSAAGGADGFGLDDSGSADDESPWPIHSAPMAAGTGLDDSGADLMADLSGRGAVADDTVLLDTTHASADPAFEAAVDAAAFDAPGERTRLDENEDSGFDLETADLSMSGSVPPVSAEPTAMTFSDPTHPSPHRTPTPPPAAAPPPRTDPLADFSPGEDSDRTVLDSSMVQSFDVPPEDLAVPPGMPASEDTNPIIEDANPVRAQSPVSPETASPASSECGDAPEIARAVDQVHATLEKVAWEAFGDLSEQVVKQALARFEAVAWEVIPQMAETLIREEIRRMQGDGEE